MSGAPEQKSACKRGAVPAHSRVSQLWTTSTSLGRRQLPAWMAEDSGRAGVGPSTQGPVDLPFPEMRNLGELARALSSVSMWQKERVSRQVLAKGWLDRLLELFHVRCSSLR